MTTSAALKPNMDKRLRAGAIAFGFAALMTVPKRPARDEYCGVAVGTLSRWTAVLLSAARWSDCPHSWMSSR